MAEEETVGVTFSSGGGGGNVLRSRGTVIIDGEPLCQDIANVFCGVTNSVKGVRSDFVTMILEVLGDRSIESLRGGRDVNDEGQKDPHQEL